MACWAFTAAPAAVAQVTAFKMAVAETAASDDMLAAFYRETGYRPLWVGADGAARHRREALLSAVALAPVHGLPTARYDVEELKSRMAAATTDRARGRLDVELTRIFLQFAHDLDTGVVEPRKIDSTIVRDIPVRDRREMLDAFLAAEPVRFLRELTPRTAEYGRLVKEKLALEAVIAGGGWGPTVPATRLERGDSGQAVLALRDRLREMGYLGRTATGLYDAEIEAAVRAAQSDFGLTVDGVAGETTIAEINRPAVDRLGAVIVAMERERWFPDDLGKRHVWVNLTDFRARIVDEGEVTFETRSVIGKSEISHRTPEFSDVIEHMVINPSWYVPRSIIVNEYLPVLRQNPHALGYMEIIDSRGRVVNRGRGFSQYTASSFPFSMRQPPSPRNALGLVKFMFPNKYNIYLHDTPSKSLFDREERAFSHGCVRLSDPFEFAYALLALQEDDPQGFFQSVLNTGVERRVNLETPVPVHLVYRTAYTKPRGGLEYRRDVYGRDAKILDALRAAGVSLPGAES
ncbi:murein L,D-transpeptidase [Mesobaculum littorinae]|uniref:Murein L,D-transpeptidase n=2 Tax=Mesobaculum littorinae TaxID=2486419 RepID=A0A438ANB5_9RHOB|nr:murein L,D-transpeptidase [Mesobaculum littorinae]